jgi:Mg-chelatase subunit ChlI
VAGSLAGMLAARTGLSPVMVGRADELARLRELATTTGEPAVALIGGEAGIGKTRLVNELATLPPTLPVLAGQGSQGAPSRPFQLLLEAVEPLELSWKGTNRRRVSAPSGPRGNSSTDSDWVYATPGKS